MRKKQILVFAVTAALLTGCGAVTVENMSDNKTIDALETQVASLQEKVDALEPADTPSPDFISLQDDVLETSISQSPSGLILNLKSKGGAAYSEVRASIVFYDENNQMITFYDQYFNNVQPGVPYTETCLPPTDDDGNPLPYNHFEVEYSGRIATVIPDNLADKLTVTSNIGEDQCVMVKLANHSGESLANINIIVTYYDENHNVIGIQTGSRSDVPDGQNGIISVSPPYDTSYNPIAYSDYEVTVAEAYHVNLWQ